MTQANVSVVIVAGGTGSRAGSDSENPKQYNLLAGVPLLARTTETFLSSTHVDRVVVVIGAEHQRLYEELRLDHAKLLPPVIGGATRQESVLAGLETLAHIAPRQVLIHDAARPFVTEVLIRNVLAGLDDAPGSLPVTLVTDTIKRSHDGKTVGGTEDRTQLFAAQTPQGFRYDPILAAHRRAIVFSNSFTDDAAIAEWAGLPVALVEGNANNIKVTVATDFAKAEAILFGEGLMETRIGTGFDVHALTEGEAVILGGISIPHDRALLGHSDADVVLHALSDALYGALADGDIGRHFPPSDPQWKGAASHIFLEHAANRVRARGGRIVNCDITLLCEAPRIGPHADAMRARIGEIAGVSVERISVKATTTEALGFVGRREGIAAQAAVSIEIPRGRDGDV